MTKGSLIVSFRQNDEKEIERWYSQYRKEFTTWALKSFKCTHDEAIEVFQQAMIIFYENVKSGKVENIAGNPKTYLFAIGKNKLYEKVRADSRRHSLQEGGATHEPEYEEEQYENQEQKLRAVEQALEKLGDPCRHILQQFYYHRASMEDIAVAMDYKNAATVKNLKYKCLQRLKSMLHDQLNWE